MKYLFFCAFAPLLFAGCNQREPETAPIVVAPNLAPTVAPTAATPPAPPKTNTIIIVPPKPKPNVIVVPPTDKGIVVAPPAPTDKKIVATPPKADKSIVATPQPKISIKPAPTAKPKPTTKPTPKATVKPKVGPTARPTAKPQPAKVAAAQPAPTLIVRAQVISTSKVPDPSTVAYSDSLVFSKYRVVSIEKGAYEAQEILVAQWGMKNKKLTAAARLRAGDSARLQLVPLDAMPKLERIMRNDDTGDYDSTPYFALEK